MAIFLEPKDLGQNLIDTVTYARRYFDPHFKEYERLAANKVRSDLPLIYPKVTDGTMSAMLLEDSKRVFQELYTGNFTSLDRDEEWLLELVNILWSRVILKGAETDADVYTKFWNMHYRSRQHGAAVAFCFFRADERYTGADFSLDYIRDVMPEAGKLSHTSSNYIWRNSYHTKLDLQNIVAAVESMQQKSKAKKLPFKTTWDLAVLKEYINAGPQGKDYQDKNLTEREKQLAATHYKLSTCFHRGYNAPFYSIVPTMDGKVVRTRYNDNPTGDTPIVAMYHVQDLVNPYGKGIPETAGAQQNVLDYMTAADVLATQKGLQPPKKIKGAGDAASGLVLKTIVDAPGAKWRVGNADVEVVDYGTSIYSNLNDRLARYKSNLMTQIGSFDTSVGTNAGNTQFSKTSAGVDSLDARTNVNDNFASVNGAIAWRQLAKTLMNIHMANMKGKEVFTLLEDEVRRLQKGGWNLQDNPKALLVYDNMRGKFDYETDDPRELDDPETQGIQTIVETLTSSPDAIAAIESTGKFKVNLGEGYRESFSRLNVPMDVIDRIIVPIDTENSQADDTTDAPSGVSTQPGTDTTQQPGTTAQRPPSEALNFKDVAAVSPLAGAAMLEQAGLPPTELLARAQQTTAVTNPESVATPTPQPATPDTAPQPEPAPAPMPETKEQIRAEHAATKQKYPVDDEGAAVIMAARRQRIPEDQIEAYFQNPQPLGSEQ